MYGRSKQTYYGTSFDRYMAHNEQSTLHKMKETYWTTKQAVMKRLGKKEDEYIVASDQELDSKLEVSRSSGQALSLKLCTVTQAVHSHSSKGNII